MLRKREWTSLGRENIRTILITVTNDTKYQDINKGAREEVKQGKRRN